MPYPQVTDTISKGVFNPVVYRPLFEHLGIVTCRTFETPAAGTIPLFLLDADYVTEIFGERALELVLEEEDAHEKILDVLARPEHYAEIVMGIREDFGRRHTPRGAPARIDLVHRGVAIWSRQGTSKVSHATSLLDSTAGAQRMQLRYGFNEIDGWAAFALGEHREEIRRRLRLMGTKVIRVFVFDKPVPDPVKEWHHVRRRAAGRARRRRQADGDLRQVPSALRRPAQHPRFRRPLLRDRLGLPRAMGRRGGEGLVLVRLERAEQSRRRRRCHLRAVSPHLRGAGRRRPAICWSRTSAARRPGSAARRSTAPSGRSGWTGSPSSSTDVDDRMLGFVSWHMYADWRPAVPSETLEREAVGRSGFTEWRGVRGPGDGADARNTKPGRAALRGCCTAATF